MTEEQLNADIGISFLEMMKVKVRRKKRSLEEYQRVAATLSRNQVEELKILLSLTDGTQTQLKTQTTKRKKFVKHEIPESLRPILGQREILRSDIPMSKSEERRVRRSITECFSLSDPKILHMTV